MKKIKVFIVATTTIFMVLYLITAFVVTNLNFLEWSQDNRLAMVTVWVGCQMFIAMVVDTNVKSE